MTAPGGGLRLVLLRHGIAEDAGAGGDRARALTPEGISKTQRAMAGLASLGLAPERILTSPLVRARQTAELAASALSVPAGQLVVTDALVSAADPGVLLAELAGIGGEVLCVGHAPHLDDLLALALGAPPDGTTRLKKSGAAAIEWDFELRGPGRLLWFLPPWILRRLGGE